MSPPRKPGGADDSGKPELESVQHRIDAARTVLRRVLQDIVAAEDRLGGHHAAQLKEANEKLVVAALRHQADAQAATHALSEATRSAEIDALTQLPNRVLLLDRFNQAITAAKRRSARVALLFLDLDGFKQINDSLGHGFGDIALQQAALRLSQAVREADTVCRYGGDEFLILLPEVSEPADAALIASKLLTSLALPCTVGDQVLRLSASIGIGLYPDDGDTVGELIDHADAAMYRAKQLGPGSFCLRGEVVTAPSAGAAPTAVTPHEQALVAHERSIARRDQRHAQLREANEKLVLAALDAQDLLNAAEQASQRQAEFMAAVAEELANPFAPIRLASAMLGRPQNDEPLLPRVQALIEQQAQQMARLVAAAGERARKQAAATAAADQASDLTTVIYAAGSDIRQTMDWRHQSLSVTMPAGPLRVQGDSDRLLHLLGNLLENASKYTPDGGTVRLEAAVDGSTVVLSVTDDGIGITPEGVPRLFEPFGHDSHAYGFNGVSTGIGLPVVRVLVNELGGTVVAQSAGNGHGSRFVVTLPSAP